MTPDVTVASNGKYWQANWTDAKGIRHRKGLGAKATVSSRDARRKAREWAKTLSERPGMAYGNRAPTLRAWIDEYQKIRSDIKPATLAVYKQTFDKLLTHFEDDIRLDRIDRVDAAAWHSSLPKNKATRAKHVRAAKAIFGKAMDLDLIAMNPFDKLSSTPPKKRNRWHTVSRSDLDKLSMSCPNRGWVLFLSLMRLAALRRGEALRLVWEDVDLDRRVLHIRPEDGEDGTKQRYRVVPIVPSLHAILSFEPGDGRVTKGVRISSVDVVFRGIIRRAGIEPWKKLCHTLRANCENEWLQEYPATDVAAWLGHSVEVCYEHYHQTSAETMAKIIGEQDG